MARRPITISQPLSRRVYWAAVYRSERRTVFASLKEEKRAADLSRARRIFLLVIISMGSSIIYTPAYLKFVFYNELMAALHITNEQVGTLLSAYAITATICYLPSGIVADKVRARTLSWVGFALTAVLTFVYATLPSYNTLMFVFVGMGLTTILIWWGIRFKVIRLISGEGEYSRNIGLSYGLYGAAGLVVGLVNTFIVTKLAASPEVGMRVLIIFLGILIAVLAVLSFLFIPRFEGEIGGDGNGFSFKGVGKALSMPVVWLSSACMFFVYFYYTGVTYTTPYLKGALGASATLVLLIGTIRTYGITLFSGPVFGAIASKVGSPSRVITVGSVLAAVVLLGFVFLPQKPAIAVLAAVLVIFLGFVANGVFGIVSGRGQGAPGGLRHRLGPAVSGRLPARHLLEHLVRQADGPEGQCRLQRHLHHPGHLGAHRRRHRHGAALVRQEAQGRRTP